MARKKQIPKTVPGIGCIYRNPGKRNWYIKLYAKPDGTPEKRFSSGAAEQQDAYNVLLTHAAPKSPDIGERATAQPGKPTAATATFNHLFDLMVADYVKHGKTSLSELQPDLRNRLRPWFGSIKVCALRKADIDTFITCARNGTLPAPPPTEKELERIKAGKKRGGRDVSKGVSKATANKFLAYLHRALKLGTMSDPRLVLSIPAWFEKFDVKDNVRLTIVSDEDYRGMLHELKNAPHARLVLVIGYHLGMRKGEILALQWDQVDFKRGIIYLERKQTKGKKARFAPIYGDMRGFLEMAYEMRNPQCPFIIQYRGRRTKDIKTAWGKARKSFGIRPLVHDLRRTAATMMYAAGVPEKRIMEVVGWKRVEMLHRYLIGSEEAAVQTGVQMDSFMAARTAARATEDVASRTENRKVN